MPKYLNAPEYSTPILWVGLRRIPFDGRFTIFNFTSRIFRLCCRRSFSQFSPKFWHFLLENSWGLLCLHVRSLKCLKFSRRNLDLVQFLRSTNNFGSGDCGCKFSPCCWEMRRAAMRVSLQERKSRTPTPQYGFSHRHWQLNVFLFEAEHT